MSEGQEREIAASTKKLGLKWACQSEMKRVQASPKGLQPPRPRWESS